MFDFKKQKEQYDKLNAFWKECERLNNMGMQAEKKGDINTAIQIYETLLQKGCDGTYPYKSLCNIYHKQKRYNDEIRVINRLRQVTPKEDYMKWDKYRWYDKRYKELTSKK